MKLESLKSGRFERLPKHSLKAVIGGQTTQGGDWITYEGNSVQAVQDYFCDDGNGLGHKEFAIQVGDRTIWVLKDGTVVR